MLRYNDLGKQITISTGQTILQGFSLMEMTYKGPEIYHTVQSGESHRLDIISYIHYDTPEYWWLLALHNNIKDSIFEVVPGKILLIPTDLHLALQSIYQITT